MYISILLIFGYLVVLLLFCIAIRCFGFLMSLANSREESIAVFYHTFLSNCAFLLFNMSMPFDLLVISRNTIFKCSVFFQSYSCNICFAFLIFTDTFCSYLYRFVDSMIFYITFLFYFLF